jgi:hypothetical protein
MDERWTEYLKPTEAGWGFMLRQIDMDFEGRDKPQIDSALADQEICRTRRIPDTFRLSPTGGQRSQTAVCSDVRRNRPNFSYRKLGGCELTQARKYAHPSD